MRTLLIVVTIFFPGVCCGANEFKDCMVDFGGCSGVIISKGGELAYGISAAHCCSGVGNTSQITTPTGIKARVRWINRDDSVDLAMFSVYSKNIKDSVHVLSPLPVSPDWTAIGYPTGDRNNGQAPKKLTFRNLGKIGNMERNVFNVKSGYFGGGDSGGAVFASQDKTGLHGLVGIMTHGPQRDPGATCSVATNAQLVEFIKDSYPKMDADCRHCIENWQAPPPPPEERDTRLGQHNLPEYMDSDRERGLLIMELMQKIDSLEKQLAQVETTQGKQGPPGPPGIDGTNGRDGKDGSNGKDASVDINLLVREIMKALPDRRVILAKDGKIIDDELIGPEEPIIIDVYSILKQKEQK